MASVTYSEFRAHQSDDIAAAQREPVEITSRGGARQAVVVSPDFFDRALETLADQADIRAAAAAPAHWDGTRSRGGMPRPRRVLELVAPVARRGSVAKVLHLTGGDFPLLTGKLLDQPVRYSCSERIPAYVP